MSCYAPSGRTTRVRRGRRRRRRPGRRRLCRTRSRTGPSPSPCAPSRPARGGGAGRGEARCSEVDRRVSQTSTPDRAPDADASGRRDRPATASAWQLQSA
eukprot:11773-Pelagococcus_subviridis.AAC.2